MYWRYTCTSGARRCLSRRKDKRIPSLECANANRADDELPGERNDDGFIDDADIADYAKEAMERFVKAGIIGGYPDGSVKPQGEATRAEFAAMMMRFLEAMV